MCYLLLYILLLHLLWTQNTLLVFLLFQLSFKEVQKSVLHGITCLPFSFFIFPLCRIRLKFTFPFTFLLSFCCSVAQACLTLCNPMDCSSPGFPVLPISQSLLKLMSIESVMASNHLIFCCLLLSCPPSFQALGSFPMSWLFARIRWPRHWSFTIRISPSNEYSRLISFSID